MKLSKSENHDPNYLAAVIELKSLRPHSNADRLAIASVFGNDCIVGVDAKIGDKYIYFPLECQIAAFILSKANLFSDPNCNADGKSKGYFENKTGGGRVKAVRLRQEKSAGYLMELDKFADATGFKISDFDSKIGEEFDMIDGEMVCQKYVATPQKQSGEPGEKRNKVEDKHSIAKRLLPNQFRFHGSTAHLGRNLHLLEPDSIISVTEKLHGQNAVFSNVLIRPKDKLINKIAKLFGAQVPTKEYQFVYSSRNVVKTKRDGSIGDDQWGVHAYSLVNKLPPGFSVIGELVGFAPGGKAIQANYDYGHDALQSGLRVFRITYTDPLGEVTELGWQDIKRFCEKYNLQTVPVHYYGRAGDLFDLEAHEDNGMDEGWAETFLKELEKNFLDKPCPLCKNKVINEGVVVAIEDKVNRPVFKFKSFEFEKRESADRDKGIVEEEN